MTLAKRLLLGTAAAFVATSGAHAADLGLPVAPSVEYVQICSIGGFTGFLLPGGDVCFDISGYARGQITWAEEIDTWEYEYGTLTLDPDSPTGTVVQASAANLLGPQAAAPGFAWTATYVPTVGLAGDPLREAVAENLAILLTAGAEVTAADIIALGYNPAVVAAVNEGWAAHDVVNGAGVVLANVAAFGGGLTIANGATVGGTFANGDVLAGLELLNSAGDNDEADFLGNARLNFDARTMTEYGLLRGFIRLDGENGTAANVDRAFVQLNVGSLGFTAGLASSAFDPLFTGYGAGVHGLYVADQASNQFSVNASIGNGVTVSLSVEDDDARAGSILGLTESDFGQSVVAGAAVGVGATVALGSGGLWTLSEVGYDGGASVPDVVAAIRVDQAWGSAKLAAALHEVNPASAGLGATSPDIDSEFGYALSASAEFNIPVGVGSTFGITGIYANGAQQFMGFDNIGNSSTGYADAIIVSTRSNVGGAGVTTSSLELTTSYVVAAGFNFGVSSELALHLDGAYADVDHHGSLFDGNIYTVRGGLTYTPVNNLSIAATVAYAASDFNTSALRTTVDDDQWRARFRVTRSF